MAERQIGIMDFGLFRKKNSRDCSWENQKLSNSHDAEKPLQQNDKPFNISTASKKISTVWHVEHKGIKYSLKADGVSVTSDNSIIDLSVWDDRNRRVFSGIADAIEHNYSKYCYIPRNVEITFFTSDEETTSSKNTKNDNDLKNEQSIEVRNPRWTFNDIYIPDETKRTIERALLVSKYRNLLFNQWKLGNGNIGGRAIVFNFYGPPGTGKSMAGEAIASKLNKKVYSVNYSELESKYVGETPKNIVKVFEKAKQDEAVLIFDEADSFLGKRLTNVSQSADYGVNITRSVMLMELEKYDGIVIFTTNLISNYDDAFKRRILASIAFDLPDEYGREKIWNIYLSRGISIEPGITVHDLASKYVNITGADIKDILLYAAVSALHRDENNAILSKEDFDDAYSLIINRQKGDSSPRNVVTIKQEKVMHDEFV